MAQQEKVDRAGVGTSVLVLCLVASLIFAAVLNNVFSKLTFDAYGQRYAMFVNQASNMTYLLVAGLVVVWKLVFRPQHITPTMRSWNNKKAFLIMGSLDATSGFLGAMGSVGTPGSFQILLNQTLIPITMLVSSLFLGHKFSSGEMGSAAIIVLGASLAVAKDLLSGTNSTQVVWYSMIVFVCSNVPNALSSVYKESALKTMRLDMFYLTTNVACFQTALTFIMVPLQAVPAFGGSGISSTFPLLYEGCLCSVGINSHDGDNCESLRPILYFACYTAANILYNILALALTLKGSAALAALSYTLQIPATIVIFAWCSLMVWLHELCERFTPYSVAGMVTVLFGFVLHSYFERRASLKQALEISDPGITSPLLVNAAESGATTPEVLAHADRLRRRWVHSAVSRTVNHDDDESLATNWYFSKLPDFTTGGLTQAIAVSHKAEHNAEFSMRKTFSFDNTSGQVPEPEFGSAPV